MLSEIGGRRTLKALGEATGIMGNHDLREDIRCLLERIPGEASTRMLVEALEATPDDDFRLAIAHSLRVRDVEVDKNKYPPQKLVPVKQTEVEPVT